jgi:hypothetical protein
MNDVNHLIELKNEVLERRRNANVNDLLIMKDLNREYSRKAKCNAVKAFNKAHVETYNNYQKLYQRNKNKK